MSQYPSQQNRTFGQNYGSVGAEADQMTLSRFFNTVYAWMCVGLALTAVVAYAVSKSPLMGMLHASPGMYLMVGLAAFALAWYVQSQVGRLSVGVATALFLLYAAIIGALISYIFVVYPQNTLLQLFLVTAGTFGAISVYGFVTKRDLTRIGSIAVMVALGFVVASMVNIFLASNALSWIITYGILVVFIIITAYETQLLKRMATDLAHDPAMAQRVAIVGALVLYISFINLFMAILRILSAARR